MSMYRQLWLALILSTVLALIGGFLASTLNTRTYLQEQLRLRNNDTAAALALSLSRGGVGEVEMELGSAALFDSGHFESIRIVDPHGTLLVEHSVQNNERGAPDWFIKLLPISVDAGRANITDGWTQLGSVQVVGQQAFAYRTLWSSTERLVLALLFAGLVGGYLSTLILRRLKKPLDTVIEQARAISDRRFFTTPEPKVPELRALSAAMNFSVLRLKGMFDEEAARLARISQEANQDTLSGLFNRAYFMTSLKAFLEEEDQRTGHLFLIRVAHLAEINRQIGRENTDTLLQRIGETLARICTTLPNSVCARLNGADFAILLPGSWDARSLADQLLQELIGDAAAFVPHQTAAFIALGSFRQGERLSALMARVDNALAGVEAADSNGIGISVGTGIDHLPVNAEEWRTRMRDALHEERAHLAMFPLVDLKGEHVHSESALRLKLDADGEWLPAGRFVSIAERLGMTTVLDLTAVRLGLQALEQDPQLPGLAVNLSGESILDVDFRQQLKLLLTTRSVAAQRLWLEVTEHGALAHLAAFRSFCAELADSGCHLGIEHFGRQFSQIGRLHDLGLSYLKVDASFVRDLDHNAGNQAFLKGMANIAHLINLRVFAEGVTSAGELDTLRQLDFDGATGPAIRG